MGLQWCSYLALTARLHRSNDMPEEVLPNRADLESDEYQCLKVSEIAKLFGNSGRYVGKQAPISATPSSIAHQRAARE